ncbi:MAG: ATP-binding protein [Pseudomonadota bacterium]|nr:ATP-binding protein [Pseudomonadota bacterium]
MIAPRDLRAIVRIEVMLGGRTGRGTGTLIAAADGRVLVLTALHVVARPGADAPDVGAITLQLRDGPALPATVAADTIGPLWSVADDWVLLAPTLPVDGQALHRPPLLAPTPPVDGPPLHRPPLPPPLLPPLPPSLQGLRPGRADADDPWGTWGFPASNPAGHAIDGRFQNFDHRPGAGRRQWQLEAPGATGLKMEGISGAPCLVEGAIVAVVVSALKDGAGSVVGGTLYAVPIAEVVAGARGALPTPDLCQGLPRPAEPPPLLPFQYLRAYGPAHAAVFFGRCAAIRRLLDWAHAPDARLLLLYGASGVGKSSLLEAGFRPRLGAPVEFVRWGEPAPAPVVGRVYIVDQAEAAFADGGGAALGAAVRAALEAGARVIVSFRKEWLPDVERLLGHHAPWTVPLPRLDAPGVIEAVHGLALPDLAPVYVLTVEDGLGERIAADLLGVTDTPVAPYLQVVLSDMWARVKDAAPRRWDVALYERVRRETAGIATFLDRQLEEVAKVDPPGAKSGLHLDVLGAFVVDGRGTVVSGTALTARYPEGTKVEDVVGRLDAAWLVTKVEGGARLAHDTLGPLVAARISASRLPAQTATRVLDGRNLAAALADSSGGEPALLTRGELAVVTGGRPGMRRWTEPEAALVEQSAGAILRRRWAWMGGIAATGIVALVVAGLAISASVNGREADALFRSDQAAQLAALAATELEDDRLTQALAWAVGAVETAPEGDPRRAAYATLAVHIAREMPWVAGWTSAAGGRFDAESVAGVLGAEELAAGVDGVLGALARSGGAVTGAAASGEGRVAATTEGEVLLHDPAPPGSLLAQLPRGVRWGRFTREGAGLVWIDPADTLSWAAAPAFTSAPIAQPAVSAVPMVDGTVAFYTGAPGTADAPGGSLQALRTDARAGVPGPVPVRAGTPLELLHAPASVVLWGSKGTPLPLPLLVCGNESTVVNVKGDVLSLGGIKAELSLRSGRRFQVPQVLVGLCEERRGPWTPAWPEYEFEGLQDAAVGLFQEHVRRWDRYWFHWSEAVSALVTPTVTPPGGLVAVANRSGPLSTAGDLQIWDLDHELPLTPVWRFPSEVVSVAFVDGAVRVAMGSGELRDVPFHRVEPAPWMSDLDDLVGQVAVVDYLSPRQPLARRLGWEGEAVNPDSFNQDLAEHRDAASTRLRASADPDAIAIVERLERIARP